MISRITATALVAMVLPMTMGAAQEPPTAEDVLLRLTTGEDSEVLKKATRDATSLLRKEHGPISAAETEALIEGLVDLILAADVSDRHGPRWDAVSALRWAATRTGSYSDGLSAYLKADDLQGEAVPEAFDALVRVYETLAARALAGGGDDPFLEAALRDEAGQTPTGTHERLQLQSALRSLFRADLAPDGRGWAYVLVLFERSKPPCKERDGAPEPPDCTVGPGSVWCAAGDLLLGTRRGLWHPRPWPGPDPDLWHRRCKDSSPWNRFSWRNSRSRP